MKIFQIIPNFDLGGAEILCENLATRLKELGHEVYVVSLYNKRTIISERLIENGVNVIFLNKKVGLRVKIIKDLKDLFVREKPDVIHTHLHVDKYVVPAAKKAGITNLYHTVHNIANKELDWFSRGINKFFYKHMGLIPVALSSFIQDTIKTAYSLPNSAIPIVYNGIDLSKCKNKNNYEINGKFIILHIGRFTEQKNHIMLLNAFKIFKEHHDDCELWFIGDGERRNDIEKYVSDNNLSSYVKFLGIQNNVFDFLYQADVFVLPSIYEGMPIVLIEAMGTGLPIISTDVGSVTEILKDGESVLITENNGNDLYEKLESIYINKDLRELLGVNAKSNSFKYSYICMTDDYLKLYKKGAILHESNK